MAVREIGRNDEWRDLASVPSPMPSPAWFWSCDSGSYACCRTQPQTGSLFPWQTPAAPTSAPTASTAAGNQSVMKQCGAQWQAAKAAGTTGGATWPQFLKACRAQLASTTSARPRRICAARAGSCAFAGADAIGFTVSVAAASRSARWEHRVDRRGLRRRRKLSIVVPDQRSFGSMSIRISTISREHAITATRKAALTCARRRLKLQVIAPR